MNYFEFTFILANYSEEFNEILMAKLCLLDFDSFTETQNGCKAYISVNKLNKEELNEIIKETEKSLGKISYSCEGIMDQNWNEVWEKNFEPIIVADKCLIYAPFHTKVKMLDYNILIEPKMAFGTGHHATTAMMLEHLLDINLEEKKVLDMGSGTGILAILASMKNADLVYAVDNDKWAYKNCLENIELNNIENIFTIEGDVNSIKEELFDIVLANINRNTLIKDIGSYVNVLNTDGMLIMSGFYVDDIPDIEQEANAYDLFLKKYLEKDNWASVVFTEK
ncbi:50S ribosomal protein L11 methyltransferase [Bacteroidota bacterium]